MEAIEALKDLRAVLMERWRLMEEFKGDYNEGYYDAIRYSVSQLDDLIRELQPPSNSSHKKSYHYHKDW